MEASVAFGNNIMRTNNQNKLMQGLFGVQKEPLEVPKFNPMSPFGEPANPYGGMAGEHLGTTEMEMPNAPSRPGLLSRVVSAPSNYIQGIKSRPGGNEALMRFGAGLLAGKNWGEGLSMGFSGAADAFTNAEQRAKDEAYRYNSLLAKANGSTSSWNKTGQQIRWIDSEGNERIKGARLKDGEPFIQDATGEWKPAHEVAGTTDWRYVNRSDEMDVEMRAGGIPNAIYYDDATGMPVFQFQREGEQKALGYALRSLAAQNELDKVIARTDPETVTSLTESLKRWAAGNADEKISAAVLNDLIGDSLPQEMQATAYRFLQGVLRVDTGAAYTGTEIANYTAAFLPSPGDTAESMKSKRLARGLEVLGISSRTGKAAPWLLGVIGGKYEMPSMYSSLYGSPTKPTNQQPTTQPQPQSLPQQQEPIQAPKLSLEELVNNPPW